MNFVKKWVSTEIESRHHFGVENSRIWSRGSYEFDSTGRDEYDGDF